MSNASYIDRMVEKFEIWKRDQAEKYMSEEVEKMQASGREVTDIDMQVLRSAWDQWVEKETNEYRETWLAGVISL